MKKLIALMLILLMAFVFGCVLGEEDEEDKDTSINAEDYIPLKKGNTWTWNDTDNNGVSSTSLEEIIGTTTIDGKTYWVFNDSDADTMYIRIANNIAHIYIDDEPINREVPLLDFNKSPGDTWTTFSETITDQGASGTITQTVKYIGLKDVTVPAGSFSDCVVFEYTTQGEHSFIVNNTTYNGTYTEIATMYFAKGVGPVKDISVITDESDGEKSESTETSELKSYNILN
jgi:hypothetical protein